MAFRSWLESLRGQCPSPSAHDGRRFRERHLLPVELLESRTVLSVTAVFSAGTLTITSDAADTIIVQANDGEQVEVRDQFDTEALTAVVNASVVQSLIVNGSASDNPINLSGVIGTKFTSLNSIVVNGGDGADTITGSPDVAALIFGDKGNDTIKGIGGKDTIDSGDGDDLVDCGDAVALKSGPNVNVSNRVFNQSEVTIAVNPTNPQNLIAAANNLDSSSTTDLTWFSRDGGSSWTPVSIPNTTGSTSGGGDPTVVFDRFGVAYYGHLSVKSSTTRAVSVTKSLDGGQTWSAPVDIPTTGSADKEFLAVGPDRNDLTKDRLYVAYHVGNVQFINSSSDGVSWSQPVKVQDSGSGINAQTSVGPNGEVYVAWQEINSATPGVSRMFFDVSLNAGLTWGTDHVAYTTTVAAFNDPLSILTNKQYVVAAAPDRGIGAFLALDVDRSAGAPGTIYMVVLDQADLDANPLTGHDDTDVFVIRSSDGGVSWSSRVRVNDDLGGTNSQFIPWLDVDQATGNVAVGWYDARNDLGDGNPGDRDGTPNNEVQFFVAVSTNGGQSFLQNSQVSSGTSNSKSSTFDYGEYAGVAFQDGIVHAVWADNSTSVDGNQDVFYGSVKLAEGKTLIGGDGKDTLTGSPGNDRIFGNDGSDSIAGGDGNDTVLAGGGADSVEGGAGNDRLESDAGNDTVKGDAGNDSILGGADDDSLFGGVGNDTLIAGNGNDTITGEAGTDLLNGGDGTDLVTESGDFNYTLSTSLLSGNGTDTLTSGSIEAAKIVGGPSNNALTVTTFSGPVTLNGAGGNDTLVGGSGNDSLLGDDGNDVLTGNGGDDMLDGGNNTDTIIESGASTYILTDATLEAVGSGTGSDALLSIEQAKLTTANTASTVDASGFTGKTTLTGGNGDDTLMGGSGMDSILGGSGNDSLTGNGGNDTLSGQAGTDSLDGGDGTDLVTDSGNFNYTLSATQLTGNGTDTFANMEEANIVGGSGNNVLAATNFTGPVTLQGSAGNDLLVGGTGNDLLQGGDGNDNLNGGTGDDTLIGGAGSDSLDGGVGSDLITESGNLNYTLAATYLSGNGSDTFVRIEAGLITGGSGNNLLTVTNFVGSVTLQGGAGNDTLVGGTGKDSLQGDSGNDVLTGKGNDDTLDGGSGSDTIIELGSSTYTVTGSVANGTLTGAGSDVLTSIEGVKLTTANTNSSINASDFSGSATLIGGNGKDTLTGGSGNDSISSGSGDDSLKGNAGNDTIFGLAGKDTIDGGAGNDSIFAGDGNDNVEGGTDNDTLDGGSGADTINGDDGADKIFGQADNDNLKGGLGNDTIDGGPVTTRSSAATTTIRSRAEPATTPSTAAMATI